LVIRNSRELPPSLLVRGRLPGGGAERLVPPISVRVRGSRLARLFGELSLLLIGGHGNLRSGALQTAYAAARFAKKGPL
jgi:hypothetical protein